MSLRTLLSNFRYSRSRQERLEEAGLIISRRLKDLLASADEQSNAATNGIDSPLGCSEGSGKIEAKDSNSPAVKTAA